MRTIVAGALATMLAALLPGPARGADLTPAEACAIAKDAYVYGFPLVDSLHGPRCYTFPLRHHSGDAIRHEPHREYEERPEQRMDEV